MTVFWESSPKSGASCSCRLPWRSVAFADVEIPLARGQSMLAPKVDGRILQALNVAQGEQVLDVGTGSGYLAACLAHLRRSVRSIEIHEDFTARARENVRASGISGITLETLDALTLEERDRYDAIAVTGSLPVYDPRFERALKIGGRLFVVVGQAPVMQALLVRRVSDSEWVRESLFETVIAPLVNAPRPSPFTF